jgi:hypothetical protein
MDRNRQFRLLIPPFFLVASVVWESYCSEQLQCYLNTGASSGFASLKIVLALLGVVGVATLPVGYAIGVLTMAMLRSLSFAFPQGSYEVPLSPEAMTRIRTKLELRDFEQKSALSIVAVFDHAVIKEPVHEWLFRRWTTFNICVQCAVALTLSAGLGHLLKVQATWTWGITVILLIGLFTCQGVRSWKESRDMFDLVTDGDWFLKKMRARSERPPGLPFSEKPEPDLE